LRSALRLKLNTDCSKQRRDHEAILTYLAIGVPDYGCWLGDKSGCINVVRHDVVQMSFWELFDARGVKLACMHELMD
jgi:hypothetical protein